MSVLTSQLVLSLVDNATKPARAAANNIVWLKEKVRDTSRQMGHMRGAMLEAAGTGYLLAQAISQPIQAATEFESAMSDVKKVVDFDTPDGFTVLSREIRDLALDIPMAATEIASLVAAAGQAGMAGGELTQFAEMAAKVGVAFDISAEQTGESLAKIKTALGLSIEETQLLADAMNHLSNSSASSAPDILNFMRRVGSIGLQYGFTAEQTAAIGSAMIAAGAEAEVAATSFRNVGKALARGESATKSQREAFAKLGLDATKVSKSLQKDAVGTLKAIITRIRQLPKEMQAATLTDLFGDEARAIAPLIENSELLEQALGAVGDQTNYAGSAQEEYNERAKTTANAIQLFKNNMNELAISLGRALLPALNDIMAAIIPFVQALSEFASNHPEITAAAVAIAGSLVALRVVTIASRFAFLNLKTAVFQCAWFVGRATAVIRTALVGLRAALVGSWLMGAVSGGGFFGALTAAASGAAAVMSWVAGAVGAAVAAISAPIVALVAAIVAAVAAIALVIYNYWEPISNFVSGFVGAIADALSTLFETLGSWFASLASMLGEWATQRLIDIAGLLGIDPETVRAALGMAYNLIQSSLNNIVDFVLSIPQRVGSWISDIFTMNDYSDAAEQGFRNAGRRAGEALVNAIKEAFWGLIEWFKNLPDLIIDAIGSIDMSNLIKWPDLSFLGIGTPSVKVDGARAAGGHIAGGKTYLVGEYGPELVTPGASGYVHTAGETAAMLSGGQGAAQAVAVNFGDIHISGVEDAEGVMAQLMDRIGDAMNGLQADLEPA
ncbi:phage tail tape measure protein [Polycladidibacter hongkongensis]|uniref:phage tail tape measure protein n=1 Tax=Polycladidibacter hongkongensis TaxID=1647556 RepID=UPI000832F555|nr:phage tail tape measure protein [Pseudovibrio hongkongensis]